MGCDIHLYVEIKINQSLILEKKNYSKPNKWKSIDKWEKEDNYYVVPYECRFYGGRNYNLFTALCGVRGYNFEGKINCVSESKGVPDDVSFEVEREIISWDGDGHSHSWNTLKELKEFDWSDYGETVDYFLNETIPKLEQQKVNEEDIRIVYFFDN